MDSISATLEFTAAPSTSQIILAYVSCRLHKKKEVILDNFKELVCTSLKGGEEFKEIEFASMKFRKYLKVLQALGTTSQKCDTKNYTDGRKFMKHLEQHPTYKSAKLHNNNVTWCQISEIIKFTVDLVEEFYEAGRTELVQFLVEWCVSFINQQSCIYTSDGWADMLSSFPQTSPVNAATVQNIKKKEASESEEGRLASVISSTKISAEPSDENFPVFHLEPISGKEATCGKSGAYLPSVTKDPKEEYRKKELRLLTCSCGNSVNVKKKGNFFGVCGDSDCGKFTCLLCCITMLRRKSSPHIKRHQVRGTSDVTEEHIKANTICYNAVCFNCKNHSCVALRLGQSLGTCKLCHMYMCMKSECGVFGKLYKNIWAHVSMEHLNKPSKSKGLLFSTPTTTVELKELQLLKCVCENVVERHNKFWGACVTPSCRKYKQHMCLICGKIIQVDLLKHLRKHATDGSEKPITAKHAESNLRLFNTTCPKCNVKSCAQFNVAKRTVIAKCKLCDSFVCTFPDCDSYYPFSQSAHFHYRIKHE